MKSRRWLRLVSFMLAAVLLWGLTVTAESAAFTYEHDPRENPEAMKDIVENPDAVYGFSPSPDSVRLKDYVNALDWTDPAQVAEARAQRQAYHDSMSELYRMIVEDGYDLVSGYKQNRKQGDPLSKTIPTKLFNATARKVSGIHNLHDFNCGLKAYRKEVVKNIEVYGEMHRYIPYLAKQAGFAKIGEKPVHHQARKFGKSKFMGWNRFVNGYLDLLTLWFLSTFGRKPMHVFGFLGTLVFLVGFLSAFGIGADKLWALYHGVPQRLVTDCPWFYIALTMMMIGTQLFLAGFLGDLISRSSQGRNDYQIEEGIRCEK